MNASVPLDEAIPWTRELPRNIFVSDSIETDGSFLLHTFASQVLRTPGGDHSLYWLTGKPVTDKQIATAMKKIGCDAAAVYLRNATSTDSPKGPLQIISLITEMTTKLLEAGDSSFDPEVFLKDVYKQIKTWVTSKASETTSCCWLVMDDVSSLASILKDEVLVFQFIDSLFALVTRSKNIGLVVRCSTEQDQTLLKQAHVDEAQDRTGWLGAGGFAQKQESKQLLRTLVPWERTIDSMDIVVDVVPLSSGYSREAHGRLVFTENPGGRGWAQTSKKHSSSATSAPKSSPWNKFVINYCLQEGGVRAIRLRETTSKG